MSRPLRSPNHWPVYPGIPIFLEAHDERATTRSYGTTPTTPTTPEIQSISRPTHLSPAHSIATQPIHTQLSPTTTIQTSSDHSDIWPVPEPPPEIQQQEPRRPVLRFYPTQRPRVRLDDTPALQVPEITEKSPINITQPGLGIVNGPSKPPSIEISAPIDEKRDFTPNIAQRIEETLWRYSSSGNILKRWLLEIISWLCSAICMAAVIGVLIHLKDKPLSKWLLATKYGLTLNTYISVLSKMAGAALILPVSEALGQLKWSWFLEHSKQMWDFEIFDNASRGPWGSVLLLVRTKGKALAALGALIMLCSLALDPFFQQVVEFSDLWALQNTSSTISRVVTYKPPYNPEFQYGYETSVTDKDLLPVVQQFLYGNGTQPVPFGNGTRPDIPLSCPTSNCTWPEYETLAVCSKCSKIEATELLSYTCLNTMIEWSIESSEVPSNGTIPNGTVCGYFINATSNSPILMSGYRVYGAETELTAGEALLVRALPLTDILTKERLFGTGSINFKDLRNPILDALIVSAKNGSDSVYRNEAPIVHECALSWCVQTIKSSYYWGQYREQIISTFENTTAGPSPWVSYKIPEEEGGGTLVDYPENVTIILPVTDADPRNITNFNATYGVDNITVTNTLNIFDEFFPSFFVTQNVSAVPKLRFRNFNDGPSYRGVQFNPWQAPNNITYHMERLAQSMSNVIRSSVSKEMMRGSAYNKETYVSVRWEWLTLPLSLLFVSLIFLAATVTKSAIERDHVGIWKTSAYATLLYGLPDEMQKKIIRSSSTGTPRSKAKELKVKWQPNQGWRTSGHPLSFLTPKPRLNQPPPGWI